MSGARRAEQARRADITCSCDSQRPVFVIEDVLQLIDERHPPAPDEPPHEDRGGARRALQHGRHLLRRLHYAGLEEHDVDGVVTHPHVGDLLKPEHGLSQIERTHKGPLALGGRHQTSSRSSRALRTVIGLTPNSARRAPQWQLVRTYNPPRCGRRYRLACAGRHARASAARYPPAPLAWIRRRSEG